MPMMFCCSYFAVTGTDWSRNTQECHRVYCVRRKNPSEARIDGRRDLRQPRRRQALSRAHLAAGHPARPVHRVHPGRCPGQPRDRRRRDARRAVHLDQPSRGRRVRRHRCSRTRRHRPTRLPSGDGGKAALFKKFAGLNSIPLVLDTKDPDEIVETIVRLRPSFGAVNLEDISAPRCFEIEKRLIERSTARSCTTTSTARRSSCSPHSRAR